MKERIFGRKPEPRLEEFRGEHSKQAGPRCQPFPIKLDASDSAQLQSEMALLQLRIR
jgi:hypothetical protein